MRKRKPEREREPAVYVRMQPWLHEASTKLAQKDGRRLADWLRRLAVKAVEEAEREHP
jgi:predicted HicB family RNase H-like nuclease